MANRIKMAKVKAILTLASQGLSQRKIAEQLGIHRETVARHLALHAKSLQSGADGTDQNQPKAPPGSEESKPAKAPLGSGSSRSRCEPYREQIIAMLEQGLSARRIYQDLQEKAAVSYYSVRRFVRSLTSKTPLPFRRLETEPGVEAQVDFGTGAPVIDENGKRRRTYVFRIVLSHSRRAYSEAVYRQTTENFIRALENAFLHFGGVPQRLVIDNLRAAVKKVDWFEPELNPKVESFCEHYGTVILPTRPAMPRHKGKVEKGIDYVQDNALKARRFKSLQEQNEHLRKWEATVADTRIHGTIRKQVGKAFEESEKDALQPLPPGLFPCFEEAQRKVHRDGHVEVAKAYYSAPSEYVGRTVWVRWDGRLVRIFNMRWEQVAVHARHEPGRFCTDRRHISDKKISTVERGTEWFLMKASLIGDHANTWAAELVTRRGVQSLRTLQGLLSLAKRHSYKEIDRACEIAHGYGAYRLADVRTLIKKNAPAQEQLEFTQKHPVIRDIATYGQLVRSAFDEQRKTGRHLQ